jgi:hypothetical protein
MDVSSASDLKVILARAAAFDGTPGFELNFLQLLAHEREALTEFLGLDSYCDSTVMTAYASFGTRLKFAHQDRILLAATWTSNIDCFVFEHFIHPWYLVSDYSRRTLVDFDSEI